MHDIGYHVSTTVLYFVRQGCLELEWSIDKSQLQKKREKRKAQGMLLLLQKWWQEWDRFHKVAEGYLGWRAVVIIANTSVADRNGLHQPLRVACHWFPNTHCCFWLYSCGKNRKQQCSISRWFNFKPSQCHGAAFQTRSFVPGCKNWESLLSRLQRLDVTTLRCLLCHSFARVDCCFWLGRYARMKGSYTSKWIQAFMLWSRCFSCIHCCFWPWSCGESWRHSCNTLK